MEFEEEANRRGGRGKDSAKKGGAQKKRKTDGKRHQEKDPNAEEEPDRETIKSQFSTARLKVCKIILFPFLTVHCNPAVGSGAHPALSRVQEAGSVFGRPDT